MFSFTSLQRLLAVLIIGVLWNLNVNFTVGAFAVESSRTSKNNKKNYTLPNRHLYNKPFSESPTATLVSHHHKIELHGDKFSRDSVSSKRHEQQKLSSRDGKNNRLTVKKNEIPNMIDRKDLLQKNETKIVNNDPEKRTKLKEKELIFYGNLMNTRDHSIARSNLKEDKDKYSSIKSFYGSKDNPAKSCRDIFLTDRLAKSGNYYIRTTDDELLMVTCGFPEVNETLVTEDEKANTTKDGESYYSREKVASPNSTVNTLKSTNGDEIEAASVRGKDSKHESKKDDSNKINTGNSTAKEVTEDPDRDEESIERKSQEEYIKKYLSRENENLTFLKNENTTGGNTSKTEKNSTEILNARNSKEDSNKDIVSPNPTGVPINYVLPNNTNKVVMKAEFSDEIKDLTKPLNSIVKKPDEIESKDKDRKEGSSDENKQKDFEKDGEKEEEKENDKLKEKNETSKESKEKDKDEEKQTKKLPPGNPEPNYELKTTTTPLPYNTLIPKMPETTEPKPTTRPFQPKITTSTTKPLKNHPTTVVPQTTQHPYTTTPKPSPTSPTPTTPKPPTTAPFRYTKPNLSPDRNLAGRISREQYKDFDKNQDAPGTINFPPATQNGYLQPYSPPAARPMDFPRPKMVGYGFNGPPPGERRPYYPPPPPPRYNYDSPVNRPYPIRPLVRPPNAREEESTGFETRASSSPYIQKTKNYETLANSKPKLSKESAAGKAGDLGDIPEDRPPPHPGAQQASNVKVDHLYGRRDSQPRTTKIINQQNQLIAQKQKAVNANARSVSWAFHEGIMKNEMNFDHQYKDFEDIDEKIDAKHKKEEEEQKKKDNPMLRKDNKPDNKGTSNGGKSKEYIKSKGVQENAKTRSWGMNRQQFVKEVSKQQYEDFEKTPQQIKQDLASKNYQQQYEAFEDFKSSTSNTNPENSTEATVENTEAYGPTENNADTTETSNTRPESTKQNNKFQPAPTSKNTTNSQLNSNKVGTNETVKAGNNSAVLQAGNSTENAKFTDYYKEYMDAVDSGFESTADTLPKFPTASKPSNNTMNSTANQQYLSAPSNVTNELIKMPLTPQLAANTSKNITQPFTNHSVPVIPINSTAIAPSKKTQTDNKEIIQNVANIITKILESSNKQSDNTKDASKRNDGLKSESSITESPNARSLLSLKRLPDIRNANPNTKTKINIGHSLRQISGPPNPIVKERMNLPAINIPMDTYPAIGSDSDVTNDASSNMGIGGSSFALHNLTGHPELIKTDTKSNTEDDSITADMLKEVLKQSDSSVKELIRKRLTENKELGYLLKDMDIPLHSENQENTNPKDHINGEVRRKTTLTADGKNQKFKSIPNAYNFIIPETRKFAVSENTDEDLLKEKEALGENQKSKLLEQRKRVELIKAQALSQKEPSMGRFSTADLKQFAYYRSNNSTLLDTPLDAEEEIKPVKTSRLKNPEPVVLLVPSEVSEITTHLGLEKGNDNFKVDSTQHSQFHKDLSVDHGIEKSDNDPITLDVSRFVKDNQRESNIIKEKPTPSTLEFQKVTRNGVVRSPSHSQTGSVRSHVKELVKEPNDNNVGQEEVNKKKHDKKNNKSAVGINRDETTTPITSNMPVTGTNTSLDEASTNSTKRTTTDDETLNNIYNQIIDDIQERAYKKQDLTKMQNGIFNAGLNMQNMITQAQMEMGNIPGLTEENQKFDEQSAGTVNETVKKIEAEQDRIKQQVDKQVKEANEENQRQAQQQVQENQPLKGDDNSPEIHNINAEALPGMDKRSLISQRPKRNNKNESSIPPFIKETIDKIRKEQRKVHQEMLELEKESTSNLLKSQYQNNLEKYKQVQAFVQNISSRAIPNITSVLQHEQRSQIKTKVNTKKKKKKKKKKKMMKKNYKMRNYEKTHHNKRKTIGTQNQTKKKIPKHHTHSINESQLFAIAPINSPKQYHHHHKPTMTAAKSIKVKETSPKSMFSDSSLAKPFFEEEKKSIDSSTLAFPEAVLSTEVKTQKGDIPKFINHKIDGNTLGSTARAFRKYELQRITSERQKDDKHTKLNKYKYQVFAKSLRGLIPSAIGKISPSSDEPLRPVGSDPPTEGPTTTKRPTATKVSTATKAPTGTSGVQVTSSVDSQTLNNMLNEVIILQRQSQQINNDTAKAKDSSVENSEEAPVEADGKPHADSGPQDDNRPESEKQSKRPSEDAASGPGESGKDEVGTGVSSKMASKPENTNKDKNKNNTDSKNKNSDKTFEAGLKEAIDHANADNSQEESSAKLGNDEKSEDEKELSKPTSQIHTTGDSREQPPQPNVEEDQKVQQDGNSSPESNDGKIESQDGTSSSQPLNQPVNVTALELGIINLLNQTSRKTHATTPHGKKMEELNQKYESLKLPVEHGDLPPEEEEINPNDNLPNYKIEEALNKTKAAAVAAAQDEKQEQQHKTPHPILPPPKSPQTETSSTPEKITEVVDATPIEGQDSNENSSNTNSQSGQEDVATTQEKTGELSADQLNNPDYIPEQITIQLPKVSKGNQEQEKSQSSDDKTKEGAPIQPDGDHQTPAELARKIATALNSLNITKPSISTQSATSKPDETKAETGSANNDATSQTESSTATEDKVTDGGVSSPPVTTLSGKPGESSIPIIPIPMDSELGKLLYPALNNKLTKTASSSSANNSTSEDSDQVSNAKFNGTDYSSILVDQARKLLRKNKLKRKDLIKLLQASRVLSDQLEFAKKNKIGDIRHVIRNIKNKKPTVRSTLTSKTDNQIAAAATSLIDGKNTIHINFKRKGGYLLLEPDKKEAYLRKLIPHAVGLYTVQKGQKKSHVTLREKTTHNEHAHRAKGNAKKVAVVDIIDEDS